VVGNLILGSEFDARDFAAYGAGVALAALFEWTAVARRLHQSAAI
jgi:hypothetical protein